MADQPAPSLDLPVTERVIPPKGDDPRSALAAITEQVEKDFKEAGNDIYELARRVESRQGKPDTSDAPKPRDVEGKFTTKPAGDRNSRAIEEAEEAAQKNEPESRQPKAERPAARTSPPVAEPAADSSPSAPTKIRLSDGRELPLELIESGLKLADRSVRLDQAFAERRAALEAKEREISQREQIARDMFGDPAARRRGAPQEEDVVDHVPSEDDEAPMTRAEFKRQLAQERERLVTEQLQREEHYARDTYIKNFNASVDSLAKRVVLEQFPELKDDPQALEDMEVLIGRDVGRSVRAGHIALPWYTDERGQTQYRAQHSPITDVHAEFRLHAQRRAAQIRDGYNKRFATDLAEYTTKAGKTSPPSRGGATVAPGAHRQAESTKVHENIEDLISDIESISNEYERAGADHGLGR